VWCTARTIHAHRILAIKTINTEEAGHEGMAEYEARFYTRPKAAGSLNHPNIIINLRHRKERAPGVHGHGVHRGRELRELLTRVNRCRSWQAVDIAAQVGEGLAYAHQHQVVAIGTSSRQHHDHARKGERKLPISALPACARAKRAPRPA